MTLRIEVHEHLGDLIADFKRIQKEAPAKLRGVIKEGIRVGNSVAKDFAKVSAGSHGKHYPNAFSAAMHPDIRRNFYSGEYGPVAAKPQGGMSFEWGSRNQPPHEDLAKSADLIGPAMPGEVRKVVDGLFW